MVLTTFLVSRETFLGIVTTKGPLGLGNVGLDSTLIFILIAIGAYGTILDLGDVS